MSNKSEQIYLHLFQYIEANLFQFKPNSFVADYEKALRNGLKKLFPRAQLTACWFHYCQAVRRKASQIAAFVGFLNKNKEANRLFRKFLVLPLLRPGDMYSAFDVLCTEAYGKAFKANGESVFKDFLIYYKRQWMEKETPSAVSVFGKTNRTTSALEGYNSRLSQKLAKHGTFFKFIDCLLDEDCIKSREFIMSLDGTYDIFEPPKKKFKDRQLQIEASLKKLDKKIISINDFLNQMTNNNNNLVNEKSTNLTYLRESEEEVDQDPVDHDLCNAGEMRILCAICFTNERSILLQPCNHFKLCSDCFTQISEKYMKDNNPILCPICKQIVKNSTRIYC